MHLATRNRQLASQSLAIMPNLLQSLKILQFSGEELEAYIKEQAEKNPLIEIGRDQRNSQVEQGAAPTIAGEARKGVETTTPSNRDRGVLAEAAGIRQRSGPIQDGVSNLENYCASSVSLRDHLRSQLVMSVPDKTDFVVGLEIIESIDPDGYFRRDPNNVAQILGVQEGRVLSVLRTLQTFDPPGVCARTLQECLKIQLIEKDRFDPAMAVLVENLPMLAAYKITALAKLCGQETAEILDMAEEIRRLDPRPGRRFDSDPALPALPDVFVGLRRDGGFTIELNSRLLPRVVVNRSYYSEISACCAGKPEKKFVVDCWKSANWLARSLDQRAQTILKVATEIVARQADFFIHGVEKLKPLSRKDIAKAIGMHDSTISRATANKFMSTNRGTFEMKFFFSKSIASADEGEGYSPETVRHKIRALIEKETAATVLSDDAIVSALRADGVDIARRTLAKYRDAMNLGTSMQRRRQKQALEAVLQ